jgi:catechol 2,3-dioxygenase-like lactoylglutathione lyase family enzyme
MKRFHVHVAVPNLAESVRFYSTLFGAEPTVIKDDYAKWMLEDPRVNFAISQRSAKVGINHLGFQVDSASELEALHAQLESADRVVLAERGANCCYAKSDKYWITDPAGIAWESFHTLGSIPMFGAEADPSALAEERGGCCDPEPAGVAMPKTKRTACCS